MKHYKFPIAALAIAPLFALTSCSSSGDDELIDGVNWSDQSDDDDDDDDSSTSWETANFGTIIYNSSTEMTAYSATYNKTSSSHKFAAKFLSDNGYRHVLSLTASNDELSVGDYLKITTYGVHWDESISAGSRSYDDGDAIIKSIDASTITVTFDDFSWTQTSDTSSNQWDISISGEVTYNIVD